MDGTLSEMRQYIYRFFWPESSPTHGSVDVHNSGVTVHFPEKPPTSDGDTAKMSPVHTSVLTINHRVLFDTNWLPIDPPAHFFKCRAMLRRMYAEYLTFYADFPMTQSTKTEFPLADLQRTVLKNMSFSLEHCKEYYCTRINVLINKNGPSIDTTQFPHIEIYVGPSLKFSSKRDLNHIDTATFSYVLDFILQKLTEQ